MRKQSIARRALAIVGALGAVSAVAGAVATVSRQAGPEPAVNGGPATVRLLSQSQYLNAVADIFGPDIRNTVRFAPIKRDQGLLALGSSAAVVTPGAIDQFDASARAIAAQALDTEHRDLIVPCRPATPAGADEACARAFFGKVGRMLYRRRLTETELDRQVATASAAAKEFGDFYRGLSSVLAAMLVSPKFLYVAERTEPDPEHPGQQRLDAYSKASRLSLFFWDAPPDDKLIAAAESGKLDSRKGLAEQVERLATSPRLVSGVSAFFKDMLVFEMFDTLAKDPVIYPAFTLDVANAAREQMMRTIVDHVVLRDEDYRDLFTTRKTVMTGDLGTVYRVPVSSPKQFTPYEFPAESPRAGLLTQLGYLSVYSHTGRSSATRRGRALREVFLCQRVPDPPPNVDFSLIDDAEHKFKTARERVDVHLENPACAGCHRLTDPMGLALENFDGAGQYRTEENGARIDTSGSLDGVKFTDAAGLGRAMRDSPATSSCLVSRLFAYSVARKMEPADNPYLKRLQGQFAEQGYRVRSLMRDIATGPGFFAMSSSQKQPARTASAN